MENKESSKLEELEIPSRKKIKQLLYLDIEKELIRGLNNSYKFYTDTFGQEQKEFDPVHGTFTALTTAVNNFLREVKKRMIDPGNADTMIEADSIETMEKRVIETEKKNIKNRELLEKAGAELYKARDQLQENNDEITKLRDLIKSLNDKIVKLANKLEDKENELVFLNKKSISDTELNEQLLAKIAELTVKLDETITSEDYLSTAVDLVKEEEKKVDQSGSIVDIPVVPVKILTVDVEDEIPVNNTSVLPPLPPLDSLTGDTWKCTCGRTMANKPRCSSCGKSKIAAKNEMEKSAF